MMGLRGKGSMFQPVVGLIFALQWETKRVDGLSGAEEKTCSDVERKVERRENTYLCPRMPGKVQEF
jgi:hypothetical protein